jgi:hypothetical protein
MLMLINNEMVYSSYGGKTKVTYKQNCDRMFSRFTCSISCLLNPLPHILPTFVFVPKVIMIAFDDHSAALGRFFLHIGYFADINGQ